jgi:fused signal recognition particle receptor
MGLREGLERTRARFGAGLKRFLGTAGGDAAIAEIEDLLLAADAGVEATERIVANLKERLRRRDLADPERLYEALREELIAILEPVAQPLVIPKGLSAPFVVLVIGVNGTGKTTTIGKLASYLLAQNRTVAIAAGDTFRAAALAQLVAWGERAGVPVTAGSEGGDPAAVAFEALEKARARGTEIVIVDTAGRLHTQAHLMDQLRKVCRVMRKLDPSAPHEAMLVLDATTGQNALAQATEFHQIVPLTGITLTKLDGTAKGGMVFALAERLGTPIRFIGVGEGLGDLQGFHAAAFVDALLAEP